MASCTLPHGPTRDLNVMYRCDRVTCVVDILNGSLPIDVMTEPGEEVKLGVLTGIWVTDTAPALTLEPRDFIQIDGVARVIGHGCVVRVSVTARPTEPAPFFDAANV